jgi:hypothetical protein
MPTPVAPGSTTVGPNQHGTNFVLTVDGRGTSVNRTHQCFRSRMLTAIVERLARGIDESDKTTRLLVTISAPVEQPRWRS